MFSVLTRQLLHDSVQTRITALHWLYHLYVNLPSKVGNRCYLPALDILTSVKWDDDLLLGTVRLCRGVYITESVLVNLGFLSSRAFGNNELVVTRN